MSEHTIKIEGGVTSFVYSDELLPLTEQGETKVVRASHVEPAESLVRNLKVTGWAADMRPSGGPVLFSNCAITSLHEIIGRPVGFETREEALAAEREWLKREKGL